MALPILNTPEYETMLPSGISVVYRPFLVKEEKIMLTIKESKNPKEILKCMYNVVKNCLISGADAKDLGYNDVEHLFILMRSRSVGEAVEIKHVCEHCGKEFPLSFDISNVGLNKEYPKTNTVMLNETVGVTVKPISIVGMSQVITKIESDPLEVINYVIETVYTEESVTKFDGLSEDEKRQFLESLSLVHVKKIMSKFEEYPRCCIRAQSVCPHCGGTNEILVEGVENFFT